MSMYQIHQIGKTTIIEFKTASLMDPLELEQMADGLYRLIDEEDRRKIILDFERVEYISSQALGIVLAMKKRLAALGRSELLLCGIGARLGELLRITGLDKVLTIKPSQKEAVKSLE